MHIIYSNSMVVMSPGVTWRTTFYGLDFGLNNPCISYLIISEKDNRPCAAGRGTGGSVIAADCGSKVRSFVRSGNGRCY